MVGPVGTGKTSVAQGVLGKLDPQQFNVLTINLSAQVCITCSSLQIKNDLYYALLLHCVSDNFKQCTRDH